MAVSGDVGSRPGQALVLDVLESFVRGFAVTAAAEVGIADALAGGPRTCDELAEELGAHAPSLGRLLRVLEPAVVVTEGEDGTFALTPLGTSLRAQAQESLRPAVQMLNRLLVRPLAETAHTVRTGEPSFERIFGAPPYAYLATHPRRRSCSAMRCAPLGACLHP